MRIEKENLLLILIVTLIFLFSINGNSQTVRCENHFILPNESSNVQIVTSNGHTESFTESLPATITSEELGIMASRKGFQDREKLIDSVADIMKSKLATLSPEAQKAYMKLFGNNGLFLNQDSIWLMLATLSQNTITEIRELNEKGDKIELDLLFSIIEDISNGLDPLLNSPDAGLIRGFLKQHYIKSISPKALWRNFQQFKNAVSQSENQGDSSENQKEIIRTLLGLGIFHNILELNLLDKNGLPVPAQMYLYERNTTNSQGHTESHSQLYNHDGVSPFFTTVFQGIGAGLVDIFVFPGLGSGSFVAIQSYFRHSGFGYWIKQPIKRRLAEKRLSLRATLLEDHLNDGSLTLSQSPIGAANRKFDPAQLLLYANYQFDESGFLEAYEQAKDDPEEVERLVRISLNQFSLGYQEILFQSMLEDQDYFDAWDKLKKINDQGDPDFDDIKEIHRIFTQASEYFWRLRNLFKSMSEKLEAFKAVVLEGIRFNDKDLVIRLIDDKISKIEEQKDKFAKDSGHLIDLATNTLELNHDRIRELIDQRPHLKNQLRVNESTPPLLEGPKSYRVGRVKSTKSVSYHTFTQDKSKVPSGKRGTVEVYKDPQVEGYPVILGVSGQADLGFCKELVKLTGIDGSHSGVIGKTHHTSYSGEVARVIGYSRFSKKLKISIETVENSTEVVSTLDCY